MTTVMKKYDAVMKKYERFAWHGGPAPRLRWPQWWYAWWPWIIMIIVEIYDAWYTKSTAGFTCPPWYLGDKGHLTHEEASGLLDDGSQAFFADVKRVGQYMIGAVPSPYISYRDEVKNAICPVGYEYDFPVSGTTWRWEFSPSWGKPGFKAPPPPPNWDAYGVGLLELAQNGGRSNATVSITTSSSDTRKTTDNLFSSLESPANANKKGSAVIGAVHDWNEDEKQADRDKQTISQSVAEALGNNGAPLAKTSDFVSRDVQQDRNRTQMKVDDVGPIKVIEAPHAYTLDDEYDWFGRLCFWISMWPGCDVFTMLVLIFFRRGIAELFVLVGVVLQGVLPTTMKRCINCYGRDYDPDFATQHPLAYQLCPYWQRPRTSCLDDCGMPSGHANVAYFYLGWAIPYFFQYYVWLSAKRRNGELVSGRDLHAQVIQVRGQTSPEQNTTGVAGEPTSATRRNNLEAPLLAGSGEPIDPLTSASRTPVDPEMGASSPPRSAQNDDHDSLHTYRLDSKLVGMEGGLLSEVETSLAVQIATSSNFLGNGTALQPRNTQPPPFIYTFSREAKRVCTTIFLMTFLFVQPYVIVALGDHSWLQGIVGAATGFTMGVLFCRYLATDHIIDQFLLSSMGTKFGFHDNYSIRW